MIKDGEQAIAFVESFDADQSLSPALVILDLNLPRKPGSEVLKHMRGSQTFKKVPIVILTSSSHHKDREETARLGASLYLRKPSKLIDFLNLGGIFKEILSAPDAR